MHVIPGRTQCPGHECRMEGRCHRCPHRRRVNQSDVRPCRRSASTARLLAAPRVLSSAWLPLHSGLGLRTRPWTPAAPISVEPLGGYADADRWSSWGQRRIGSTRHNKAPPHPSRVHLYHGLQPKTKKETIDTRSALTEKSLWTLNVTLARNALWRIVSGRLDRPGPILA